jgi:hypothetical protein
MNWDLVKVLNLLGVVLEFLSFWFAAPEILGEERLRALERGLEKGMKQLPNALGIVVAQAVLAPLAEAPLAGMAVVVAAVAVAAMAAGVAVADKSQEKVVAPVLRVLADDERIRQRALMVGAVLFMIAFLCQCTAALLDISGP